MPHAAAADRLTSATVTRKVSIVVVDPETGGRVHLECHAPSNTLGSDLVLVDPNDFVEVVRACDDNPTRG
jgi:hypothetical protein